MEIFIGVSALLEEPGDLLRQRRRIVDLARDHRGRARARGQRIFRNSGPGLVPLSGAGRKGTKSWLIPWDFPVAGARLSCPRCSPEGFWCGKWDFWGFWSPCSPSLPPSSRLGTAPGVWGHGQARGRVGGPAAVTVCGLCAGFWGDPTGWGQSQARAGGVGG